MLEFTHPSNSIAERERDFSPSSWDSLESALRYEPTVPLARMMLANVLEKEELAKEAGQRDAAVYARAAHWRRYDLDRLPHDDPQLWARAAEILRDAPEGGDSRRRPATDHGLHSRRASRDESHSLILFVAGLQTGAMGYNGSNAQTTGDSVMSEELQLLQQRVRQLENDVSLLKSQAADRSSQPWWERISGRFENDPVFDEIVRLGREYREAQRPEGE